MIPSITSLPIAIPVVGLLALVPLAALILVRRGQPEHPPRISILRFAALYMIIALVLLLAALVDDLPMSLGLLGAILAFFGLGVGVESLYRYLYGGDWLDAHPGVVRRDIARWERVTLLLAVICLVAAVALALAGTDAAVALALAGTDVAVALALAGTDLVVALAPAGIGVGVA
jgi:hypothetical protein